VILGKGACRRLQPGRDFAGLDRGCKPPTL
jgi:hypothetical protein